MCLYAVRSDLSHPAKHLHARDFREFVLRGGCPGIAIFSKIKACSKNYRRHIVDIGVLRALNACRRYLIIF
ncbi:MAG: hypothetical protein B1H11_06330 [Desulfobacteraceae bacterium 4484_190.1]|nr:MAG: hypothetical protein B1H11_06330 [Desulfobacteraceae bacterium 4484_190.1]